MRNSMIPSVPARLRHWGVAAVAAVIAAVWVTMSLIVPSLAQNGQPETTSGSPVVADLGVHFSGGNSQVKNAPDK